MINLKLSSTPAPSTYSACSNIGNTHTNVLTLRSAGPGANFLITINILITF